MNDKIEGALAGIERIVEIEAILDHYPDVTADQLQSLLHWFRTEASAYEIGMIASNPYVADGYRRFRADHIDRFPMRNTVYAIIVLLLLSAGGIVLTFVC